MTEYPAPELLAISETEQLVLRELTADVIYAAQDIELVDVTQNAELVEVAQQGPPGPAGLTGPIGPQGPTIFTDISAVSVDGITTRLDLIDKFSASVMGGGEAVDFLTVYQLYN